MSNVIVTALLIIASVTAVAIVISTVIPSIQKSSQLVVRNNQEIAERIGTDIKIIAVASHGDGQLIEAWVKNIGIQPVDSLSRSDVFVITPGQRFRRLEYDESLSNGTWHEVPIGAQLNRSQTIQLKLLLPLENSLDDGIHLLKIGTPNGIVSEKAFSK